MTERKLKLPFSFQRTINAYKEGRKLIIRGGLFMSVWEIPAMNNVDEFGRNEVRVRPSITIKDGICQSCGQPVEKNDAALCKHFQECPGFWVSQS